MADKDAELDLDDDVLGEDITEGVKRKKLSGKKLVLFGGIGVLLLALAGGGASYFGVLSSGEEVAAEADSGGHGGAEKASGQIVFYDLPEMLVTLNPTGGDTNYLKIKVTLELDNPKGTEQLDSRLPRIIDNFQVYLRELRLEDLEGSAGLVRLKEELLVRVNAAVNPVRVRDVLFKEMLVQ